MKWTTEKTTKPGWYWVCEHDEHGSITYIAHVSKDGAINWGTSKLKWHNVSAKWSGPIPEPED